MISPVIECLDFVVGLRTYGLFAHPSKTNTFCQERGINMANIYDRHENRTSYKYDNHIYRMDGSRTGYRGSDGVYRDNLGRPKYYKG